MRITSRKNRLATLFLWLSVVLFSNPAAAISLEFNEVSRSTAVVDIRHAGDGSQRLFLVRQNGRVNVLSADGQRESLFLDISDQIVAGGERGLLSIAFAPDYSESGVFYAWYTIPGNSMRLAAFEVTSDPNVADSSATTILTVPQPASNHNGGRVMFGPDGYLYLSIGDGGGANDEFEQGQDPTTLLATIIRIDPDPVNGGYSIPATNPFVGDAGKRDEIWAWGLRNPWRISFDRSTGDLFIADVGQRDWEEVNVQPALSPGGENYGWPILEGTSCFQDDPCDDTGLTPPVAEYSHSLGCSITGGEVYRGNAYPDLEGMYLYGDYCSGRIWGLTRNGSIWEEELLVNSVLSITTFGEGEDGALYVADGSNGVYLISDGPLVSEPEFAINQGLNDSWFNAATDGQGFFIMVYPNIRSVFLAWFTYDTQRPDANVMSTFGEPGHRWITAFGGYEEDTAVLEIELTEGGELDSGQPVSQSDYGHMVVKFTGCNTGSVMYQIPSLGLSGTVPIARLASDNVALCESLSK